MVDVECRKKALKYPVEGFNEEVKKKWGCCKTKWEAAFDISGIVPLGGREMLAILGNGDYSEGVWNVSFDNSATRACLYDLVVDTFDDHIFNGRPSVRYVLVKALSRGPG